MENTTVDYSWQDHAACAELDLNMFYPAQGKKYAKEAAAACVSCPVKEECLSHALKYEEYGYWAGTSPKHRIELRKELGIELVDISYESSLIMAEEVRKHEEFTNSLKIKGRGRKPKSLHSDVEDDTIGLG